MNFWNKLWRKNNISETSETHSDIKEIELKQESPAPTADGQKPEISIPPVHIEQDEQLHILLKVEQSVYEASRFDIDFRQEKDSDGRPDGSVHGGIISLTLKGTETECALYAYSVNTMGR